MSKPEKCFYERTNYPGIFQDVYWGNFSGAGEPEVIRNRNLFVKHQDIKAVSKKVIHVSNRDGLLRFDHNELYKTNLGAYVFITSPYAVSDGNTNALINAGLSPYINLYSERSNAMTFIGKFKTLRKLNEFLKKVNLAT